MVVELACTCDDLPAHSHVWNTVIDGESMRRVIDDYDVRIWVDWREVSKALIKEGDTSAALV